MWNLVLLIGVKAYRGVGLAGFLRAEGLGKVGMYAGFSTTVFGYTSIVEHGNLMSTTLLRTVELYSIKQPARQASCSSCTMSAATRPGAPNFGGHACTLTLS